MVNFLSSSVESNSREFQTIRNWGSIGLSQHKLLIRKLFVRFSRNSYVLPLRSFMSLRDQFKLTPQLSRFEVTVSPSAFLSHSQGFYNQNFRTCTKAFSLSISAYPLQSLAHGSRYLLLSFSSLISILNLLASMLSREREREKEGKLLYFLIEVVKVLSNETSSHYLSFPLYHSLVHPLHLVYCQLPFIKQKEKNKI